MLLREFVKSFDSDDIAGRRILFVTDEARVVRDGASHRKRNQRVSVRSKWDGA